MVLSLVRCIDSERENEGVQFGTQYVVGVGLSGFARLHTDTHRHTHTLMSVTKL